jgi:hypothetical protein
VIQSQEFKVLGNAAAIAGKFDEAVENYSAGIALNPSSGRHPVCKITGHSAHIFLQIRCVGV